MEIRKFELQQILIDQLYAGQYQTRRDFAEEALYELAESIKSVGVIQPLVVRSTVAGRYEIIAGERRWRAATLAGLNSVPCLLCEIADDQAAAVTTIENLQREDLNPIEEAEAYFRLIEEFQYSHEEIAAIIGKSRAKITNALRLLRLDSRVQELLITKQLSAGHGKIIAGIAQAHQYELANKCVQQQWSVREIEQEIKKISAQDQITPESQDPDVLRLERICSEQFAAQVKLETDASKRGGWIKIRYFDNDTLAGLLDKMGIDHES